MKLKMFLIGAGLMLAMITGNAQAAHHDSIRVKIVKNENGTLNTIDTAVAAAQHDQLMQWLSSQGIDLPHPPPPMEGDSMRREIMIVEIEGDSLPHGEFMRVPAHPPAPGTPLPPHPPGTLIMRAPAPPPGHEGDVMIIVCDSTMRHKKECKKVIINEKKPGSVKQPGAPKEIIANNELVIYPNPSKGRFTLEINMPGKEKADITITDMNGKTVYSEQLSESDGKITKEIDLGKYGKGMYSVRLSKGGKVIIENVVVE